MVPDDEETYSNGEGSVVGRGELILDLEALNDIYVPDVLEHRAREMNALRRIFSPGERLRMHAVIVGEKGVGKTTLWKAFTKELTWKAGELGRPVTVLGHKCIQTTTASDIYASFTASLGGVVPLDRSPKYKYKKALKKALEGKRTILVIDEAHYILSDERERWVIRDLWTLSDSLGDLGEMALALIVHPEGNVVLARMGHPLIANHMPVEFAPYDREQLEAIARQRVKLALAPGSIDDDCIGMVADAGLRFEQARTVVQTLRKAAGMAESLAAREIVPDHIRNALGKNYTAFCESDMFELSMHERFALIATSLMLRKRVWVECRELYEKYVEVCEDNLEDPRAETTFREMLHRLSYRRFVLLTSDRVGRSTRLIVGMDVPSGVIEATMERTMQC